MSSVSIVVCDDEATARAEAASLAAEGVSVRVRLVNKTSGHSTDECTTDFTNRLGEPVWVVTAIED